MSSEPSNPQRIPSVPLWLGLTGLIPFGATALASAFLDGDLHHQASLALLAYGAVILSFLGGVRWGAALHDATAVAQPGPLTWSVVPSLVAWAALLLGGSLGLLILAAGLVGQYVLDRLATQRQLLPAWYGRLRLLLTCGATASVLVAWVSTR